MCSASRVGKGITPGKRRGSSPPARCLSQCIIPVKTLVYPCHPNSLLIPKNVPSQIQEKLCMCLQKDLIWLNQHFAIFFRKIPVQYNIHENNEYSAKSTQPEHTNTFVWFTYDYPDWPLIRSFTLPPPDAFAHWQTIFFSNQLARRNVSPSAEILTLTIQ